LVCNDQASDNDFLKLRRTLAAQETEEDMIAASKKNLKNKCFTTEQIKNLSVLFLTNNGKYQFFHLAYNYVSDEEQFGSLQSEIKDEYYIKRFKALINE